MTVSELILGRNQWAFVSEETTCQVIRTDFVQHDLVVTFSSQANKWAIMARVGADTMLDSLDTIVAKIKEINKGLFGGIKTKVIGGAPYYSGETVDGLLAKLSPFSASGYLPASDNCCYEAIAVDSVSGKTRLKPLIPRRNYEEVIKFFEKKQQKPIAQLESI